MSRKKASDSAGPRNNKSLKLPRGCEVALLLHGALACGLLKHSALGDCAG
jgi:hypothetical protein